MEYRTASQAILDLYQIAYMQYLIFGTKDFLVALVKLLDSQICSAPIIVESGVIYEDTVHCHDFGT